MEIAIRLEDVGLCQFDTLVVLQKQIQQEDNLLVIVVHRRGCHEHQLHSVYNLQKLRQRWREFLTSGGVCHLIVAAGRIYIVVTGLTGYITQVVGLVDDYKTALKL